MFLFNQECNLFTGLTSGSITCKSWYLLLIAQTEFASHRGGHFVQEQKTIVICVESFSCRVAAPVSPLGLHDELSIFDQILLAASKPVSEKSTHNNSCRSLLACEQNLIAWQINVIWGKLY